MRSTPIFVSCLTIVLLLPRTGFADQGRLDFPESAVVNRPPGLPWADVFQWLARKTGKPVITAFKLSGSLAIPLPDRPEYTLPEILDILNDELEDRQLVLIQRKRSFTIVPSDEAGDGRNRVELANLDNLGNREIASVVVPLKCMPVQTLAPKVKQMMGKYAEVVPLELSNSLLLEGRVASLKRVRAALARVDSQPVTLSNSFRIRDNRPTPRCGLAALGTEESPEPVPVHVLSEFRVDLIVRSKYYGAWIAAIRNVEKKEESHLLIDRPLPRNSRFQTEKSVAELAARPLPAEPSTRCTIRGKEQDFLLELQVVRIDPLRVIVQAEGNLFSLALGASLEQGLMEPLDEGLRRALTQATRGETLRRITLSKLSYSKDRLGYQGLFVNPSWKDEKTVLATDMLPEEFEAPDSWRVKSDQGIAFLTLRVVKVEKQRVVFTAEQKFYSIKPGGNLFDAMAKPLSDAGVKALNLPGS